VTEALQIPARFTRRRRRGRQRKPPRTKTFEDRYAARLFQLIDDTAATVLNELDLQLESIVAEQEASTPAVQPIIQDAPVDRIIRVFERVTVGVSQLVELPVVQNVARDIGEQVSDQNSRFNTENVEAVLGVQVFPQEPWLRPEVDLFTHNNVSLIKNLTEEQTRDIEQAVFRGVQSGSSAAQIRADIAGIVQASKSRAKLIARDQVNKFNGRLSELRQTAMGVEKYTWRTSDDERVRPDHQRLDDTVFSWDAPPVTVTTGKRAGERNHPGGDINCRCIAEAVFPDEL